MAEPAGHPVWCDWKEDYILGPLQKGLIKLFYPFMQHPDFERLRTGFRASLLVGAEAGWPPLPQRAAPGMYIDLIFLAGELYLLSTHADSRKASGGFGGFTPAEYVPLRI